jgi:hypothetical protein
MSRSDVSSPRYGAHAADPIMPASSETLIGDEKLHLFYLFYQVEIR